MPTPCKVQPDTRCRRRERRLQSLAAGACRLATRAWYNGESLRITTLGRRPAMIVRSILCCGLVWMGTMLFDATATAADSTAGSPGVFSGKQSEYRGYRRWDFVVDGCPAIVVAPRQVAAGRPWVWRAEFFDAFPQVDLALLAKGFHLAYVNVGNTFGCPDALAHWDVFYKELTGKHGLSPKPVLEGLSRGGLYCFNWAASHPRQVGCILADNAVLDFKSWPGGKGKSPGSPGDWQKLLGDYHFPTEAAALAYTKNPVDNLAPLAKDGVPLFLLCGDADDVVPYPENGAIVKHRYEKLGGTVRVLLKHGMGHHPHGPGRPDAGRRFHPQADSGQRWAGRAVRSDRLAAQ